MATKPASGTQSACWECRTRRLLCDLRQPGCYKCEKNGRDCSGYGKRPVRFIQPNQVQSKKKKAEGPRRKKPQDASSEKESSPTKESSSDDSPSDSASEDTKLQQSLSPSPEITKSSVGRDQCKAAFLEYHLGDVVAKGSQTRSLFQTYHSWLEPRSRTMHTAVDSLLLSHVARVTQDRRLAYRAEELHTLAVSQLRRDLSRAGSLCEKDLIGSVAVMALHSRLGDASSDADRPHRDALITLFKARGPSSLESPFERGILLNMLPRAMNKALLDRRPLIFGSPKWNTSLARICNDSMSKMALIATRLPNVLHVADKIAKKDDSPQAPEEIVAALQEVNDLELAITDWYDALQLGAVRFPKHTKLPDFESPAFVPQDTFPFESAYQFAYWTFLLLTRRSAYRIHRYADSPSTSQPQDAELDKEGIGALAECVCRMAPVFYHCPQYRSFRGSLGLGLVEARGWYEDDCFDASRASWCDRFLRLLEQGEDTTEMAFSWPMLLG